MNEPAPQPPDPGLVERKNVYDRMLNRGSIGWQTERPFRKVLGTGGQGTVLLAEKRGAGRFRTPVALKFFSPQQFETALRYENEMLRLTDVASHVARIQDDHLVDVHTFIEDDGVFYLEMEWIDGFDLLHILHRDTLEIVQDAVSNRRWRKLNEEIVTTGEVDCRLQPGMAVAILRECLAGVSALHDAGVIHCDLKPSNVMVKRTGQVKLIDIGSAFHDSEPPEGQPCTPEYAAPEILMGRRATAQSDLASLGYMLLEMLTGSKPFAGLKYSELVDAKVEVIDRLSAMLPQDTFPYSEALITLMRKLLHPDPEQRFKSARAAEFDEDGASAFLRQLVMSDKSQEYTDELRQWVAEMETKTADSEILRTDNPTTTTHLYREEKPATMILPLDDQTSGPKTTGFELGPQPRDDSA